MIGGFQSLRRPTTPLDKNRPALFESGSIGGGVVLSGSYAPTDPL